MQVCQSLIHTLQYPAVQAEFPTFVLIYSVALFLFVPGLCVKALVIARLTKAPPALAFSAAAAAHSVSGLLALPAAWLSVAGVGMVGIVELGINAPATPLRAVLKATVVWRADTPVQAMIVSLLLILGVSTTLASAADSVFLRWLLPDAGQATRSGAIRGNVLSHVIIYGGITAVLLTWNSWSAFTMNGNAALPGVHCFSSLTR